MNNPKTHLFLMDMAISGSMNGVSRCIQVIVDSFSKEKAFQVIWAHFENHQGEQITRVSHHGYTQVTIPLPPHLNEFLIYPSRQRELWERAYRELRGDFSLSGRNILHLHTLNLMPFALYVREREQCRIVSHLHCIPWKALYNYGDSRFYRLYQAYYVNNDYTKPSDFILHGYERDSYTRSDSVVCVTRCAKDFIQRMLPTEASPVTVIPNGIADVGVPEFHEQLHVPVRCLFVGNGHPGKGLDAILRALALLQMHYELSLVVAGHIPAQQRRSIMARYPFLDVQFVGILPFAELREYYLSCDIGLIASVQEQCSYAAIEMMMFGLPIISTDVDGLHELFADYPTAMKIPLVMEAGKSLHADVRKMAKAISLLIEDSALRRRMAILARARYRRLYQQRRMTQALKRLYHNLCK